MYSNAVSDMGAMGIVLLALYFLPVLVSVIRKTGNAIAVFLVCLFFGWTFLGWIVALIMAFGRPANTTIVNVHQATPLGRDDEASR